MTDSELLKRIARDPKIFGGKPIVRGRRLALEHVLAMISAASPADIILAGYPWLDPEDIDAWLLSAKECDRD